MEKNGDFICKEDSPERGGFRGQPWIAFLPEIYDEGEESFLARYLSVFQEIYEGMTEEISLMPHRLYPEHADRGLLEWLADWLGLVGTGIWNDSQLAYLIANWSRLLEIRGTRAYMEEIVKLYTGFEPYIVEYHRVAPYMADSGKAGVLGRLYGSSPCTVTVIISRDKDRKQRHRAEILYRIVKEAAPAGVECRLIFLQPCIYLGGYSYMGVNSSLSGRRGVKLDERELLPCRTVVL